MEEVGNQNPLPSLGRVMFKMNLKHLVIPESKEANKDH